MSTADEIRALIENAKENLKQQEIQKEQTQALLVQAKERRNLRLELCSLQNDIDNNNEYLALLRDTIAEVDDERHEPSGEKIRSLSGSPEQASPAESMTKCDANVAKGEYVWKIEGMSWLVDALKQECMDGLSSPSEDYYCISGHKFDFVYAPLKGNSGLGTLSIRYVFCDKIEAIPIRYRISVQKRAFDFELLNAGSVYACKDQATNEGTKVNYFHLGPHADTQTGDLTLTPGLFGLSHDALLKSDWVLDDSMTVKFEIELRIDDTIIHDARPEEIAIPPTTLCNDLSSLLNSGKCSDVNFVLGGKTIKAHSQILSARSEVFDKMLNSGMNESITKEVVVEDCDRQTFKALLQFIYTDNCDHMMSVLCELCGQGQESHRSDSDVGDVSVQCLQDVLAASQKYALVRLARWCEQQLCKQIAIGNVCSVLCQAHLQDAKQLEKACLEFIRKRKLAVVVTEGFISLSRDWPEVMLKINMFDAGVSSSDTTSAVELLRRTSTNKRKRDE